MVEPAKLLKVKIVAFNSLLTATKIINQFRGTMYWDNISKLTIFSMFFLHFYTLLTNAVKRN